MENGSKPDVSDITSCDSRASEKQNEEKSMTIFIQAVFMGTKIANLIQVKLELKEGLRVTYLLFFSFFAPLITNRLKNGFRVQGFQAME
jgi:hypothetical protein